MVQNDSFWRSAWYRGALQLLCNMALRYQTLSAFVQHMDTIDAVLPSNTSDVLLYSSSGLAARCFCIPELLRLVVPSRYPGYTATTLSCLSKCIHLLQQSQTYVYSSCMLPAGLLISEGQWVALSDDIPSNIR